jgi:hypothetical protein
VFASSAVDRGFEPQSGQTKGYTIGICCFSAKYESLRRKSKDWLARNMNNVPEWSDMKDEKYVKPHELLALNAVPVLPCCWTISFGIAF